MKHEIEGQMSIFDFLKPDAEVKVYYKVDELYVWKTVHCSECVNANINVNDEKFCKYTECSKNGYSNFESKEKTICQYSKHECNKENLWKVADSLDGIECERKCCRLCEMRMLCGARCNGADNMKNTNEDQKEYHFNRTGKREEAPEWLIGKKRCEMCLYWQILNVEFQPGAGWGVIGTCTSHRGQGRSTQAISYCDDFEKMAAVMPEGRI